MKRKQPRSHHIVFLILTVFFIFGLVIQVSCQRETKWPGLAVNVEFSDRELTDYLVTVLKLKFITTSNFRAPEQDWRILAEAFYENRFVFRESFAVNPGPKLWHPNHVYEAEKYIFIPALIDSFRPEFSRGVVINFQVYAENDGQEKILLYEQKLRLKPCPPEIPDVLFLDGWKNSGRQKNGKGIQPSFAAGQTELWMEEKAICLIKNPGKPSRLMIRGEGSFPPGESQKLRIYLDGKAIDDMTVENGPFQKIYELSADLLGENLYIKLSLVADRTFPGESGNFQESNGKRYGVKIYIIYLR